MIITVEHTGGERPCHFCDGVQDMYSINIKTETIDRNIHRLRLCTPCSKRFRDDVVRAVI